MNMPCYHMGLCQLKGQLAACADPEGGTGGLDPPPEKSQKQYWFGSPENNKAAKPAFNVGPSSAHQRNII